MQSLLASLGGWLTGISVHLLPCYLLAAVPAAALGIEAYHSHFSVLTSQSQTQP